MTDDLQSGDGFTYISKYFDTAAQMLLLAEVRAVIAVAPLYRPAMPRTGKLLSVAMTNCGDLGWLTDTEHGYRYVAHHPSTDKPWPSIPQKLLQLWTEVSGFPLPPQACLINYYEPSARLGSHRDEDEEEKQAPVVSVSLGDTATFHIGGSKRTDPKRRLSLKSGDVVILGGASRLAYHGIDRIHAGTSDLLAEGGRINLTLRRVTRACAL
jgi:DNA oxidative demethylase